MFLHPIPADDQALGVLVFVLAPAVFVLILLFNAHQMGKFKKTKRAPSDRVSRHSHTKWGLIICCMTAVILLGIAIQYIF
ncbi:hypothetical protein [uncultured Dysosmobacter sp.]|uniref:hypothetical protein n=1 Tax=uncultured Dysosmobacter sp. TaxID=2591384 RepID=UPI002610A429|nr:hypothetical protein [uncultured Dysosmobacter sp.]